MKIDLDGILIIDKPLNVSSAKIVSHIKKSLKIDKVGHGGTLDPIATGILICFLNSTTKLSRFFLNGDKKYEAILTLGIETDSQDFTGKIICKRDIDYYSEEILKKTFEKYEGLITQIPPVYSALKHNGVPLYKFARKGINIEKPARKISIFYNKILNINLPDVHFEVKCSSGTYIRTLCSDIGKEIGCGAHLKELRRVESGGFNIKDAITIDEFNDLVSEKKINTRVINSSDALRDFKKYIANNVLTEKIRHGKIITDNDLPSDLFFEGKDFYVKLLNDNNRLLSILKYENNLKVYRYCCNFKQIQ